jgi:hypothetical protein
VRVWVTELYAALIKCLYSLNIRLHLLWLVDDFYVAFLRWAIKINPAYADVFLNNAVVYDGLGQLGGVAESHVTYVDALDGFQFEFGRSCFHCCGLVLQSLQRLLSERPYLVRPAKRFCSFRGRS